MLPDMVDTPLCMSGSNVTYSTTIPHLQLTVWPSVTFVLQARTAMWTASLHGHTAVVETLLSHGAHVDHAGDNEVSWL